MSKATPENKVKREVRKLLNEFAKPVQVNGFSVFTLKQFWPVPSGFGASDLDVICCYYGKYFSIETKAPGKTPTPRQRLTLAETNGAGGATFVIDGEQDLIELRAYLQGIYDANNS